jgi:hypothetical protein
MGDTRALEWRHLHGLPVGRPTAYRLKFPQELRPIHNVALQRYRSSCGQLRAVLFGGVELGNY